MRFDFRPGQPQSRARHRPGTWRAPCSYPPPLLPVQEDGTSVSGRWHGSKNSCRPLRTARKHLDVQRLHVVHLADLARGGLVSAPPGLGRSRHRCAREGAMNAYHTWGAWLESHLLAVDVEQHEAHLRREITQHTPCGSDRGRHRHLTWQGLRAGRHTCVEPFTENRLAGLGGGAGPPREA